jgi:hypothetical protein
VNDVGQNAIAFYDRMQRIGHVAVNKGEQLLAVILAKDDSCSAHHAEGAEEEMTLFSLETN